VPDTSLAAAEAAINSRAAAAAAGLPVGLKTKRGAVIVSDDDE
jgi:hypothetical protein